MQTLLPVGSETRSSERRKDDGDEAAECIWHEISDQVLNQGAEAFRAALREGASDADAAKAARFACYRYYIFTVSSWTGGMGRVRLPVCVEAQIKAAFRGDDVFTWFQDPSRGVRTSGDDMVQPMRVARGEEEDQGRRHEEVTV